MNARSGLATTLWAGTLALALGLPALGQARVFPLAAPPAATNQAATTIFNAMLAISRAAASNPAAAQAATFPYAAAIQRYQAGDLTAARREALQAISVSGQLPNAPPAVTKGAAPPPSPLVAPGGPFPGIVNPAQADAEAFLAISRRALATCGVTDAATKKTLLADYANAVQANVAGRYNDVRTGAHTIIQACAVPAAAAK